MYPGIAQLADLYPRCFFPRSHLRRPLKLGIHKDIIEQHPELDRIMLGRSLGAYTHGTTYWLTVTARTLRIGLDGSPAGEVTIEEEEHAKRKIAKAAKRAAAAVPVEKCTEQQNPIPEAKSRQPTAPAGLPRLGLAGLKAAALARRQAQLQPAE